MRTYNCRIDFVSDNVYHLLGGLTDSVSDGPVSIKDWPVSSIRVQPLDGNVRYTLDGRYPQNALDYPAIVQGSFATFKNTDFHKLYFFSDPINPATKMSVELRWSERRFVAPAPPEPLSGLVLGFSGLGFGYGGLAFGYED